MNLASWDAIINKPGKGISVYLVNGFYTWVFKLHPDWPKFHNVKKKGGG